MVHFRFMIPFIGGGVVALMVAILTFRLFFDNWTDYSRCTSRFRMLLGSNEPGWDYTRGFYYKTIWLVSGFVAFCVLTKLIH